MPVTNQAMFLLRLLYHADCGSRRGHARSCCVSRFRGNGIVTNRTWRPTVSKRLCCIRCNYRAVDHKLHFRHIIG
ncbi:Uncharacterised protein [Vibrio cholerae]|nr:Uncharacterised protein [Vibrio cholerae]